MNTARKLSKVEIEKNKVEKALKREELRAKTTPSEALMLYEKGMLSADSVLEKFGYDPDQEIERKRYDAIQMQCLGLGLGQEETERTRSAVKATQINTLSSSIESTRRTIELIWKQHSGAAEGSQIRKDYDEYIKWLFQMTEKMAALALSEDAESKKEKSSKILS